MPNYIDPSRESFDFFKSLPRDQPVEMLNLVAFNTRADYPQGHPFFGKNLTGAEAYQHYSDSSLPIIERIGARIVWRGEMEAMLIGPTARGTNDQNAYENWDRIFVARYPTAAAFLEMVTDPAYKIAVVHRQAAVRTSRLIRCKPTALGGGFG